MDEVLASLRKTHSTEQLRCLGNEGHALVRSYLDLDAVAPSFAHSPSRAASMTGQAVTAMAPARTSPGLQRFRKLVRQSNGAATEDPWDDLLDIQVEAGNQPVCHLGALISFPPASLLCLRCSPQVAEPKHVIALSPSPAVDPQRQRSSTIFAQTPGRPAACCCDSRMTGGWWMAQCATASA